MDSDCHTGVQEYFQIDCCRLWSRSMIDTVDTVETVDTVDTIDTVDTVDIIEHY